MSRSTFGGGIADFVISASASGGTLHLTGAALTFWSAKTGGTQYADLLLGADGSGGAAASVLVGADGQVPQFQGPDGVTQMWADAGASRVLMTAPGAGGSAGQVVTDDLGRTVLRTN